MEELDLNNPPRTTPSAEILNQAAIARVQETTNIPLSYVPPAKSSKKLSHKLKMWWERLVARIYFWRLERISKKTLKILIKQQKEYRGVWWKEDYKPWSRTSIKELYKKEWYMQTFEHWEKIGSIIDTEQSQPTFIIPIGPDHGATEAMEEEIQLQYALPGQVVCPNPPEPTV